MSAPQSAPPPAIPMTPLGPPDMLQLKDAMVHWVRTVGFGPAPLTSDPRKQILQTPYGEIYPPYGTVLIPLWQQTSEFNPISDIASYTSLIRLYHSLRWVLQTTMMQLCRQPVLEIECRRALEVKAARHREKPHLRIPEPFPEQCFSHVRFSANLTGWVETKGFEGTVVAVRAFGKFKGGNIGILEDRSQRELKGGDCILLEKDKKVCVLNFEGLRFQFEFFMPPREQPA